MVPCAGTRSRRIVSRHERSPSRTASWRAPASSRPTRRPVPNSLRRTSKRSPGFERLYCATIAAAAEGLPRRSSVFIEPGASRALAQKDVGRALARDVGRAFVAQGAHVDAVQEMLAGTE